MDVCRVFTLLFSYDFFIYIPLILRYRVVYIKGLSFGVRQAWSQITGPLIMGCVILGSLRVSPGELYLLG